MQRSKNTTDIKGQLFTSVQFHNLIFYIFDAKLVQDIFVRKVVLMWVSNRFQLSNSMQNEIILLKNTQVLEKSSNFPKEAN